MRRTLDMEGPTDNHLMVADICFYLRTRLWEEKLQVLRQWQSLDLVLLKSAKFIIL